MMNEEYIKNNKNEIFKILDSLRNIAIFTHKNSLIYYPIENFFDKKQSDNPIKKDEIIHQLASWGSIQIHSGDEILKEYKENGTITGLKELYIQINQPNFDNLYNYLISFNPKKILNKITPIDLPKDIKFSEIELIVGIEDFDIFIKEEKFCNKSYKDLGCYNSRTIDRKPDKIWEFFRTLSVSQGKFNLNGKQKNDDISKTNKKKLSERLKIFFKKSEDPFYSYDEKKSYETKFKLSQSFLDNDDKGFSDKEISYNDNVNYNKKFLPDI